MESFLADSVFKQITLYLSVERWVGYISTIYQQGSIIYPLRKMNGKIIKEGIHLHITHINISVKRICISVPGDSVSVVTMLWGLEQRWRVWILTTNTTIERIGNDSAPVWHFKVVSQTITGEWLCLKHSAELSVL